MQLVFTDERLADKYWDVLMGASGIVVKSLAASVCSGVPVLLDGSMRPVEPWCTYLRLLSHTVSVTTIRNYGYDASLFAGFLDSRGVDVVSATHDDLLAYRQFRLAEGVRTVSASTWHRNTVVIRGVYSFLVRAGVIESEPWFKVGRRTVLDVPIYADPEIRSLSRDQWFTFRDVGLCGQRPGGELDGSWRGRNAMRSRAAADIALTTGMRLGEWRTLLDCELPDSSPGDGASMLLQACAKYQKPRRVHIPGSTLQSVDFYRSTERRRSVRASQANLSRHRTELAFVDSIDAAREHISFTLRGQRQVMRISAIPPNIRRILVKEGHHGLESMSLFVGHGGLPPGHRSWLRTFELANHRLTAFRTQIPLMPNRIRPHDLRHTFAVVLLRNLMTVAHEREGHRPTRLGHGTLSEHIALNPLLTLQRLLGHSSPATTMVYLRHVEDTDALVQHCFESWSQENRDYSDYILADRDEAFDAR